MVSSAQAVIVFAPVLRVGGMRFSAVGICSILGVLAAFTLLRWTATMAGLEREPVIDAGWFGVLAGLVVSRAMLVVHEPVAFLHYPVLVLALPSFTYVDLGLTVVAIFLYLRRKKLPVAKVLDAWVPCLAIAVAAISVGQFVAGTHPGVPTTMPWGVLDARLGRIHPVQMYEAGVAVWLCVMLLALLARPHVPGHVARLAMISGGLASFALDELRQPDPGAAHALLEPAQWLALGSVLVGCCWLLVAWGRVEPEPSPSG